MTTNKTALRACGLWLLLATICSTPAAAQDAVLSEFYGSGVHHYFAGNYSQAIADLGAAIDNGSRDPRAYYFRGLAKSRSGYGGDADFQTGAALETSDSDQYYPVGKALERVQGSTRMRIERFRALARATAMSQQRRRDAQRYEQLRQRESARNRYSARRWPRRLARSGQHRRWPNPRCRTRCHARRRLPNRLFLPLRCPNHRLPPTRLQTTQQPSRPRLRRQHRLTRRRRHRSPIHRPRKHQPTSHRQTTHLQTRRQATPRKRHRTPKRRRKTIRLPTLDPVERRWHEPVAAVPFARTARARRKPCTAGRCNGVRFDGGVYRKIDHADRSRRRPAYRTTAARQIELSSIRASHPSHSQRVPPQAMKRFCHAVPHAPR